MKLLRPIAEFTTVVILAATLLAQSSKVNREELPQPVLNEVVSLVPGGSFGGGTKVTEKDGTVKYAVSVQLGDERISLVISPDGKLYERSERATFAALPTRVQKRLVYICSGEPDSVTKVTPGNGQPVYKFSVGKLMEEDGSKRMPGQDNLGSNAEVVKREDLPQPVLTTIEQLHLGTEWVSIKLGGSNAKYGLSYMVQAQDAKTRKKKFFVISPDGKLDERWNLGVKFADLPDPIRKIAKRANGAGEETLVEVTADGKKPYYRFALHGSVAENGRVIMEKEN